MRLVAVLIVAFALAAHAQDSPPAGRWEGSVKIPERELHLVIDLGTAEAGWSGTVSIPDLGLSGVPLTAIERNGGAITFALKNALADQRSGPAKFSAHLTADGQLTGDFTQGGNTAPFTLVKTGPPQLQPPPRSTSVVRELEGEWKGSYELFGYPRTVTLKLQNRGAEGATADFVIVGRKENKLPVDLVTQNATYLLVDSHETGLSFEGQLEKNELKGTIIQGPLEIPLTLRREK